MTASFAKRATVTASTKRLPAKSRGKVGAAVTNLSSFKCTPLDPVGTELRNQLQISTPVELLQTFTEGGLDILDGDILVVSSTEYPIQWVGDWTYRDSVYKHIVIANKKIA